MMDIIIYCVILIATILAISMGLVKLGTLLPSSSITVVEDTSHPFNCYKCNHPDMCQGCSNPSDSHICDTCFYEFET